MVTTITDDAMPPMPVKRTRRATVPVIPRGDLVPVIRETYRQRQDLLRAETRLTLQIKAIERRTAGDGEAVDGDQEMRDAHTRSVTVNAALATLPLMAARDGITAARKPVEKALEQYAKQLPVYPWIDAVRGVSALSLAAIVGEAGDLSNYDNPAKLWKRMGMAVMPDGARQRRVSGAAAIEHGYVAHRRSVMYVIGTNIVKLNRDGAYRTGYDRYKQYQKETHPELTAGHHHMRAQRYAEKMLLRDLWKAWRRAENGEVMTADVVIDEGPVLE